MINQLSLFGEVVESSISVLGDECWRECPGFPRYEVSSHGRFRRVKDGYIMSQGKEINGYPIVLLSRDGKQHAKLSHRLICEAFNGPAPIEGMMVNHIDRSRTNNVCTNLEWVTRSGNAKHWRANMVATVA